MRKVVLDLPITVGTKEYLDAKAELATQLGHEPNADELVAHLGVAGGKLENDTPADNNKYAPLVRPRHVVALDKVVEGEGVVLRAQDVARLRKEEEIKQAAETPTGDAQAKERASSGAATKRVNPPATEEQELERAISIGESTLKLWRDKCNTHDGPGLRLLIDSLETALKAAKLFLPSAVAA